MYGIGEVSRRLGLTVSTLRYYDREGLLRVRRDPSGIRRFDESDLDALRVVEYLKRTGMPLRDIRTFMEWCREGDATLALRRDMFYGKRDAVEAQLRELERARDLIRFKCWYYETAARDGTEARVRSLRPEDMPEDVRRAYESSHGCGCPGFPGRK